MPNSGDGATAVLRAVWHYASFGIWRRSAFAPFGIRAVRHLAPVTDDNATAR
jgi:hypothetical protein